MYCKDKLHVLNALHWKRSRSINSTLLQNYRSRHRAAYIFGFHIDRPPSTSARCKMTASFFFYGGLPTATGGTHLLLASVYSTTIASGARKEPTSNAELRRGSAQSTGFRLICCMER
ncbi:hypothetical protein BDN70DRAFT_888303 [Pholiota conissans]|uniref:Uncharacterized protein n=1 Tax=Pholiota conissans TaxID=109636 RepID=A0A9P5YNZ8_9AGAR|nr:hypothetical protein BDN70DRAFT_888303 [Pholiota conissans]